MWLWIYVEALLLSGNMSQSSCRKATIASSLSRADSHTDAVLTDEVIFQYKCDNFYAPQSEGAIAWNDPSLGIDWKIKDADALLSEKDKNHPTLSQAEWLFDYNENLY